VRFFAISSRDHRRNWAENLPYIDDEHMDVKYFSIPFDTLQAQPELAGVTLVLQGLNPGRKRESPKMN